MPEKSTRKAGFEVCTHSFRSGKETYLLAKAYLCVSVIQALFGLYFLYTGCFYNLMVCLCRCGKKNSHIQTHTLFEKRFQETRHMHTASHSELTVVCNGIIKNECCLVAEDIKEQKSLNLTATLLCIISHSGKLRGFLSRLL